MAQKLFRGEVAKTPFCNNPKCDLHQYQVDPRVLKIEVNRPGIIIGSMTKKAFTRELFESEDGQRRAFFCEVCVSAIDTAQKAVGETDPG